MKHTPKLQKWQIRRFTAKIAITLLHILNKLEEDLASKDTEQTLTHTYTERNEKCTVSDWLQTGHCKTKEDLTWRHNNRQFKNEMINMREKLTQQYDKSCNKI